MKLYYSVYLIALIIFCSICSVGVGTEVAKPTSSPTVEVRPLVTNEELLQKLLDNMEKDQVNKKDIYDVLLQTKSDKIGLLQGNISAILTWGGIVLTIMTVGIAFLTMWLNRVFTNKVDIISEKAVHIEMQSLQVNHALGVVQNIQNKVNLDMQEIHNYLKRLEDISLSIQAIEFEQKVTRMRHNLQLSVLKFKNTLDKIHQLIISIDSFDSTDTLIKSILDSHAYETYHKPSILEHEDDYLNWEDYEITEEEVVIIDEEHEESPDEEADTDYLSAIDTMKSLQLLLAELISGEVQPT